MIGGRHDERGEDTLTKKTRIEHKKRTGRHKAKKE